MRNETVRRADLSVASPDIHQIGGVDILVVLGKNIGVERSRQQIRRNPRHLSMESKFNVRAAGQIAAAGLVHDGIIFSSGHTAGKDVASEAFAMFGYYLDRFPKNTVPVVLEEGSFETSTNAKEVKNMLERPGREDATVGLITVGYHLDRAKKFFENYGVELAYWGASEDWVRQESQRHARLVSQAYTSDRVRMEEVQEQRRRIVQKFDRKGRIPQLLTRVTRG